MILSLFSALSATLRAAATAAPQEIPARIPSLVIKAFAVSMASSLSTVSTWSTKSRFKLAGINPAPIP
jgi:hypothetical protein